MTSLEGGTAATSPDEADALARDAADPLRPLRDRFHVPTAPDGSPAIYLAGQSLGLQPRSARAAIERELAAWERLGVDAWFEPGRPWFTLDGAVREPMARIVGALPTEVALLNSLTVNLHLLLASFFRPDGRRRRILADGPLFPSDRHALATHLAQRGLDPDRDLVVVGPRPGESTIRTEDLEAAIAEHAADLAVVFLAGVNFATGQAHPIERLTVAGHAAGALVGWDLAHAAGNVELSLHDWDVDFAAWCTYKYLNGGPGSVGAIFVHERHGRDASVPRLGGWWGMDPDVRFDPDAPFVPAAGAAGWATSTTSILALAPVAAALAIVDEVGMPALRARSVGLTGYLEGRLDRLGVEIVTPRDVAARGAQLSLRFDDAGAVLRRLAARGVVADHRAPDLIRIAPIPQYASYHDLWRFGEILREVIEGG
jgi:kynureninase